MAHQEGAQGVAARGDLVRHDALTGLQPVVVAPQLRQGGDGGVARAVRVMDRRAIDGRSAVPPR